MQITDRMQEEKGLILKKRDMDWHFDLRLSAQIQHSYLRSIDL